MKLLSLLFSPPVELSEGPVIDCFYKLSPPSEEELKARDKKIEECRLKYPHRFLVDVPVKRS